MLEFTGERVVPGRVAPDLWNEHFARYLFAARLARGKRVIDIGCGSGYGSAELGRTAQSVLGVDLADDAVAFARESFGSPSVSFETAAATALPCDDHSVELAVAFEVIEHLDDAEALVREASRVLTSAGQFVVSTPNEAYYAESRKQSGPNPFHTREFTFEEFRELLLRHFAHVTIFTQNHSPAITFQPVAQAVTSPVTRLEAASSDASEANFFVAVCSAAPQIGSPTFVYVPSAGNVLRERELHITRLEGELRQKQIWLDQATAEHAQLVEQHRALNTELAAANAWAKQRDADVEAANALIAKSNEHIAALDAELSAAGEAISSLRAEGERAQAAAAQLAQQLEAKVAELSRAVELLAAAESTVEERTRWAQALERERDALAARLREASESRWLKLGRTLSLGPDLRS